MFNGFRDLVPGASGEITVLVKNISTMKMKNGDRCQKISVRDVDGMEMTFMKFDGLMNIELPAVMTLDIDCTPKDRFFRRSQALIWLKMWTLLILSRTQRSIRKRDGKWSIITSNS